MVRGAFPCFANSPYRNHCNHGDQVYDMSSYVAVAGTPQVEKPNAILCFIYISCILGIWREGKVQRRRGKLFGTYTLKTKKFHIDPKM